MDFLEWLGCQRPFQTQPPWIGTLNRPQKDAPEVSVFGLAPAVSSGNSSDRRPSGTLFRSFYMVNCKENPLKSSRNQWLALTNAIVSCGV